MPILTPLQQALDWTARVAWAMWWFDWLLVAAGGLVIAACLARWSRDGWRDPLVGSPVRPNTLTPFALWLVLVVYLLASLAMQGVSLWLSPGVEGAADIDFGLQLVAGCIVQIAMTLACLAVLHLTFRSGWRGLIVGPWRADRDICWAFVGYLAAAFACSLAYYGTVWIILFLRPEYQLPDHTILMTMREASTPVWQRYVALFSAGVLAPVFEEVFFRGLCQSTVKKLIPPRWGSVYHRWLAIVIVAVVFGLMHMPTPHQVPALIVLGVLLGYSYERTGSLMVPILLHMIFNGKTLLYTLMYQALA